MRESAGCWMPPTHEWAPRRECACVCGGAPTPVGTRQCACKGVQGLCLRAAYCIPGAIYSGRRRERVSCVGCRPQGTCSYSRPRSLPSSRSASHRTERLAPSIIVVVKLVRIFGRVGLACSRPVGCRRRRVRGGRGQRYVYRRCAWPCRAHAALSSGLLLIVVADVTGVHGARRKGHAEGGRHRCRAAVRRKIEREDGERLANER